MANVVYNSLKRDLMLGAIDLADDTIKLMLVTSAYTPNVDTNQTRSDVTNEVTGAGYTAGGATLSGKSVTIDEENNEAVFDADNVVFSAATITARAAVIYQSIGTADQDRLICYLDFGSNITSTGGDFIISFSTNGILRSGSL